MHRWDPQYNARRVCSEGIFRNGAVVDIGPWPCRIPLVSLLLLTAAGGRDTEWICRAASQHGAIQQLETSKCAFNKCMKAAPVATLELPWSNIYKAPGVHLFGLRVRPKLMQFWWMWTGLTHGRVPPPTHTHTHTTHVHTSTKCH